MATNKMQNPIKLFTDWRFCLPFKSGELVDLFLDEFMGTNPILSSKDRLKLVKLIYPSFSLSFKEKKRVIEEFPNLSQFQQDKLIKVFKEEREKFVELQEDHPEDIWQLKLVTAYDWATFINPTHGHFAYIDTILRSKSVPPEMIARAASHLAQSIMQEENYAALSPLIKFLLSVDGVAAHLSDSQKANLKNNYLYAQVEIGKVKSQSDFSGDEFLKTFKIKTKKTKDFLSLCEFTYVGSKYGNTSFYPKEKKKLGALLEKTTGSPDLVSWTAYLHLTQGEIGKAIECAAQSVVDIELKNASLEESIEMTVKHYAQRDRSFNTVRNMVRYFILHDLHPLKGRQVDKNLGLEPEKLLKQLIRIANDLTIGQVADGFNFLVWVLARKPKRLRAFLREKGRRHFFENEASQETRFLGRLVLDETDPTQTIVEGFQATLQTMDSKHEALYFMLVTFTILRERLPISPNKENIKNLRRQIENAYQITASEKGWQIEKECDLLKPQKMTMGFLLEDLKEKLEDNKTKTTKKT